MWKKDLGEERKKKIKLEKELETILSDKEIDKVGRKKKKKVKNAAESELSSKISLPEILCTICAVSIADFQPKYFCGTVLHPACENCDKSFVGDKSDSEHTECKHRQQCVIRQPYPPPSPSSPFIVHEVSKYHIHMMTKNTEDLVGCIVCFSVNNENYGCDKCTWLKWWFKWHGDRHGLPDIHPSVYRKYL